MQLKIPNDEQLQAIYRDMHKVEEKTSGIARLVAIIPVIIWQLLSSTA